jgi:hypothetical protein
MNGGAISKTPKAPTSTSRLGWSFRGAFRVFGPKKPSRVHVPSSNFEAASQIESALNENSLSLLGLVSDTALKSPVIMLKRLISVPFATAQLFTDIHEDENPANAEARRAFIDLPQTGNEACIVYNCREDERLKHNIFVTGLPYVRFYAGVALIVNGKKVGALLVADREARDHFSKANKQRLIEFGFLISGMLQDRADARTEANEESTKMMVSLHFLHLIVQRPDGGP